MENQQKSLEKLKNLVIKDSKIRTCEIITNLDGSQVVCKIEIESTPTLTSYIQTVVWLPKNWNGILLGLGNGGMAGSIKGEFWTYTQKGYATTYTDMGTSLVVTGEQKTARCRTLA